MAEQIIRSGMPCRCCECGEPATRELFSVDWEGCLDFCEPCAQETLAAGQAEALPEGGEPPTDFAAELRDAIDAGDLDRAKTLIARVWAQRDGLRRLLAAVSEGFGDHLEQIYVCPQCGSVGTSAQLLSQDLCFHCTEFGFPRRRYVLAKVIETEPFGDRKGSVADAMTEERDDG